MDKDKYYDDGLLLSQDISLIFLDIIVIIDDIPYKAKSTINIANGFYISVDSLDIMEQVDGKLFWKCIRYIVDNISWMESESNTGALFDNTRKIPSRQITQDEISNIAKAENCEAEYIKLLDKKVIESTNTIIYSKELTTRYYTMAPKFPMTVENVFSLLRDSSLATFVRLNNLIHVKESEHMQEPTYPVAKGVLLATIAGYSGTYTDGKLEYTNTNAKSIDELIELDGFDEPVLTHVNMRLQLFCKQIIAYPEIYVALFMHPRFMQFFTINEKTRDISDSHHMAIRYRRDGNTCNINVITLLHGNTSIHLEETTSHLRIDIIHIYASQIDNIIYDLLDLFSTINSHYKEIRKISRNLGEYRRIKTIEPITIAIENSICFGKDTTHRTGNQGDAKPIIFERRQLEDVLVLAALRFPDIDPENCVYHRCDDECLTLDECKHKHKDDELLYLSMRPGCSNIVFIKIGSTLIPSVRNNATGTIERHNSKNSVSIGFYANTISEESENIDIRGESYKSPLDLLNRYLEIEDIEMDTILCMQELFDYNVYELRESLNNIQTFTHFRILEELLKSNVLVFLERTTSLEIPRYAKYHLRHFRYKTTIYMLLDVRGNYHLFYNKASKDKYRFKNNRKFRLMLTNLYFAQLLQYNVKTKRMTKQKEHITEPPPDNAMYQHINKNGKVIAYVIDDKYEKLEVSTIPIGGLKLYYEPPVDNMKNINRMYAARLWALIRWYWMIERLPVNEFLSKIVIVDELPVLTNIYENFPKVKCVKKAIKFLHRIWPGCFSKEGEIHLDVMTAKAIKQALRVEVRYIPKDIPLPYTIDGIYEWLYMDSPDIFTNKDLYEDWLLRRYAKLTCSIYLPIREFSISHGQDLDRYRRFLYRKDGLVYLIVNNSGNNQQRTKASLNTALYIAQMYKRTGKIPPFQDIPPVQYDIGQYTECTLHTLPKSMPKKQLVIITYANNAHRGALLEIFEV